MVAQRSVRVNLKTNYNKYEIKYLWWCYVFTGSRCTSTIGLVCKLPIKNKPKIFYSGPILTCANGYPIEYMKPLYYRLKSVIECPDKESVKDAILWAKKKGACVIKTAVVSKTFDGKKQVV